MTDKGRTMESCRVSEIREGAWVGGICRQDACAPKGACDFAVRGEERACCHKRLRGFMMGAVVTKVGLGVVGAEERLHEAERGLFGLEFATVAGVLEEKVEEAGGFFYGNDEGFIEVG